MSKLINCYHIKKKHPPEEEDDDEEEEEATTETTCELRTAKSNDCDTEINSNIGANSPRLSHSGQPEELLGRRSPVAVSTEETGRRRVIVIREGRGTNGGTNVAHRLLALVLTCLTLSCLHDDWHSWRWRQHRQLFMKNAQETKCHHDHDTNQDHRQQSLQSPCDDWPVVAYVERPKLMLLQLAEANVDANRLYEDLMMTYNRIVLPVQNNSDRVVVRLGLKLSQLIDVNLKNQMMTTNVWLNQEWIDYKLKWDPSEYGGIEDINLPAEQIWLPDIVLYNSAEGYFAVSIYTKAKVRYDGHVTWNPPAIFRSSCQIDITYFPFDSQNCHLKFGSWTFGTKIDLRHINDTEQSIEYGTDLSEYYQNVEWDIMKASAKRNVITYICCPNDFYPDVTFNFTLRRKPLFYTVNLILPCIGITILSFLVFYLPSDSGEKVTLTISILVSLIFFLCVLIETIPSTSTAMPLLGKYLVFTMILITLSVCATVGVLNIHFRTPSTHSMSPWAKRWCIEILPKYLFMNVPQYQSQPADSSPILPEQLIYPHNQAYQQMTDWSALVKAAQRYQQQPPASSGANQQQIGGPNSLAAGKSSQANGRGAQRSARPPMQLLDISKLSHQSSTSSFLPYLTSEAARRLQMQRSRSSERASSNNCDSAANGNHNIANPGNHIGAVRPQLSTSRESAAIQIDQISDKSKTGEPDRERSLVGGKSSKKSGSFWRAFGGRDSSNKSSLETTNTLDSRLELRARQQTKSTTSNQVRAGANKLMGASSPSSSSSFGSELDYQHHNHFQARASICSTNMWRIGPTRRCSLAAAAAASNQANYSTFYRPLAHLSQRNSAHNRGHQAQVVNTISGTIGPANYPTQELGQTRHHHQHQHRHQNSSADQFDDANWSPESSGSPLMGGFRSAVSALANAAVTSLPIRTKAISQMHNQQQQHFLANFGATGRHHQVYPAAGTDKQEMRQLSSQSLELSQQFLQSHPAGIVHVSQLQHPTPPPPLPPELYIHEQLSSRCNNRPMMATTGTTINRTPYTCRADQFSPDQHLQQQIGRQLSGGSNKSAGYHMANLDDSAANNSNTASSTTATTVMMVGDHQQAFQQQQQPQQFLDVHLNSRLYKDTQEPQQQFMIRSRSTDHRLCQLALGGSVASNQYLQRTPSGGQRNTIGRALGQVYVERLRRQPTVQTMLNSEPRQGRSIHRNASFFDHDANDCIIRRSRSQTSLNHHRNHQQIIHRAIVPTCRQCNQHRGCTDCPGSGCRTEAAGKRNSSCYLSRQPGCSYSAVAQHPAKLTKATTGHTNNRCQDPEPLTPLGFMKLISEVDKAIQNAMFIAQHIDNLDEFESVKENWKYIAMVIDRIFLIVFLFACIVGSAAIFMMVPWSHYTVDQPIDLQLVRSISLNFTAGEPHPRSCRDDF